MYNKEESEGEEDELTEELLIRIEEEEKEEKVTTDTCCATKPMACAAAMRVSQDLLLRYSEIRLRRDCVSSGLYFCNSPICWAAICLTVGEDPVSSNLRRRSRRVGPPVTGADDDDDEEEPNVGVDVADDDANAGDVEEEAISMKCDGWLGVTIAQSLQESTQKGREKQEKHASILFLLLLP